MRTYSFRDLFIVLSFSMLFALKLAVIGAALSAIVFSMVVHFDPTLNSALLLRLFLSVPVMFWLAGTIWFARTGLRLLKNGDDAPGAGNSQPGAPRPDSEMPPSATASPRARILSNALEAVENWSGINLGVMAVSGRNCLRRRERDAGWTIRLAGPGRMNPLRRDRKRLLVYLPAW